MGQGSDQRRCWWNYHMPTEPDLRLMYEALQVCEIKGVVAKTLMGYSLVHFAHRKKTKGMVIRSPKDLWNAVCGPKVSQTNGLMAQFNQCLLEPCEDCKRERDKNQTKAAAWVNPNLELHARHPVAPPPPPMATCATCGQGFEAVGSMARERDCRTCKQKKSDETYKRGVADGTIKPVPTTAAPKNNFAAFNPNPEQDWMD